jgi:hypothetical protein
MYSLSDEIDKNQSQNNNNRILEEELSVQNYC